MHAYWFLDENPKIRSSSNGMNYEPLNGRVLSVALNFSSITVRNSMNGNCSVVESSHWGFKH